MRWLALTGVLIVGAFILVLIAEKRHEEDPPEPMKAPTDSTTCHVVSYTAAGEDPVCNLECSKMYSSGYHAAGVTFSRAVPCSWSGKAIHRTSLTH